MLETLLLVFVTGACGAVMLSASQHGLLKSVVICVMLGATFAYILTDTMPLPSPLIIALAVILSALLIWLGKTEHTTVQRKDNSR